MKLLEKLKKLDPKQILRWLCWIKYACWSHADCRDCPFKGHPDSDGMLCRVRNIYKKMHPEIKSDPPYPDSWASPWPEHPREVMEEPSDLDFLYKIEWDDWGDPIPELKEGIK